MSNLPLVSAIIPAYKAAAFVANAVDSILAQDHGRIEIIVVDDCSPDDTAGALKPYIDAGQVRLIRQERNQGVAVARNTGIRAASGEFIAFLDADDLWLPHHVSRALAVLRDHADIDIVLQDFDIQDMVTKQPHGRWFEQRQEAMRPLRCTEVAPGCHRVDDGFLSALMVGCFVHVQATVSRRRVFDKVLFDERIRCSEDVDWAMRSVHVGRARWAWMSGASGIYHRHPDSLTTNVMRNHEVIEKTSLMLYCEYLGWPDLQPSDRRHVQQAIVYCCLELSYFSRTNQRLVDAWRYWLRSLAHGVSRKQLIEGLKVLVASPAMAWRGLQSSR